MKKIYIDNLLDKIGQNIEIYGWVHTKRDHKKIVFIDTEGGIAVDRVQQITKHYEEVLKRVIFFQPVNFNEQDQVIESLRSLINEKIGLIIVDSIAMLYRLELGQSEDVHEVNSILSRQIACLVEIARKWHIPVLVVNQVYADFENKDRIKMVGGDLLKYSSKCLLELSRHDDARKLILRRHRSLPEGLELKFKIIEKGLIEIKS